jgi:hypothetical protein
MTNLVNCNYLKKNKKLNNLVIDASTDSEHVQAIKCDFKPGSVERSIDLDKEGTPQAILLYSANETR